MPAARGPSPRLPGRHLQQAAAFPQQPSQAAGRHPEFLRAARPPQAEPPQRRLSRHFPAAFPPALPPPLCACATGGSGGGGRGEALPRRRAARPRGRAEVRGRARPGPAEGDGAWRGAAGLGTAEGLCPGPYRVSVWGWGCPRPGQAPSRAAVAEACGTLCAPPSHQAGWGRGGGRKGVVNNLNNCLINYFMSARAWGSVGSVLPARSLSCPSGPSFCCYPCQRPGCMHS